MGQKIINQSKRGISNFNFTSIWTYFLRGSTRTLWRTLRKSSSSSPSAVSCTEFGLPKFYLKISRKKIFNFTGEVMYFFVRVDVISSVELLAACFFSYGFAPDCILMNYVRCLKFMIKNYYKNKKLLYWKFQFEISPLSGYFSDLAYRASLQHPKCN